MRQESPLISVIIPTYNRAGCIERAVNSVLAQTYTNLEVIVVDDGSEDNTESVVASMPDGRVRYVKQDANRGAAAARNAGVRHAEGELIAFQDSDDYWYPDKLEKQMNYWEKHPEYSMIYGTYIRRLGNGHISFAVPGDCERETLEGNIFEYLILDNSIGAPTMILKKEAFMEVGGFDETMSCLEDWDFAVKFALKYSIGFVEEPVMDALRVDVGVSNHKGEFYFNRCKIIGRYRQEMTDRGIFDEVIRDLFEKAQKNGILPQVQSMLMTVLRQGD
jgi:glycosyltransferase involved in cell wall biosynthesis